MVNSVGDQKNHINAMADTIPGNNSSTQNLAIGTSTTSEIDFLGDADWWRVTLQGGFTYQVWVYGSYTGRGTLNDPFLSVYNANGVFQFSNDDISFSLFDSFANVTPTGTGTFFLGVSESGNNAIGSYTIRIWEDQLASTSTGANLPVNSISTVGQLGFQNDNSDWYAVTLTAGIQYQFDMIGAAADGALSGLTLVDPALYLRSSLGAQLAFDDDGGAGKNSRIFFTPTVTGTYFLDAQTYSSSDTGSYRIVVNATPTVGAIALGTPKTGALSFRGDTDLYSVNLIGGQTYNFFLDGTTLSDPYLELLNGSGNVLDTDDDSGTGLNSSIQFTPASSGLYFLAARSSGNKGTGGYALTAAVLPTVTIKTGFAAIESNTGTSNLVFEVKLSAPSTVPVSVDVGTSGSSTATVGVDYIAKKSTLTFAPGQTSLSFTVQVIGDTLFEPTEVLRAVLSNPVGAVLGTTGVNGFIFDNDAPYQLPSDADITFQWYLYPTTGINVFPLWPEYTGRGVRVAVFDDGIDPSHPDLDGNLLVSLGRNASNLSLGGSPILSDDNHGTAVAGTIAAERNGEGVVGVAYDAALVSIYNRFTAAEIANAFSYAKNFDILNDSWGFAPQGSSYYAVYGNWAFLDNFLTPAFAPAGNALRELASQGRNGLGTIVVQAAGNSFLNGDDTNLHNFQNSQYIITVAATDYLGKVTSYSSQGASVLVAAPGGGGRGEFSEILTTDRIGAAGNNLSNYDTIIGTSFSAPIVSGVVALMLEANPRLGYRDVQEILASTARITAPADNVWQYNGSSTWNGGGMHYDAIDHNLGFGLVDAWAAVRLAETWQGVNTAANRQQASLTRAPGKSIPDNSNTGAFDAATITSNIEVERVEVTLKVTHSFVGDLSVLLTSPSGTSSWLLWRPQQSELSAYGTNQANINFTFTTVLSMGESAAGTWTLRVFDYAALSVGTFDSWTLNIIGKAASADDTYVFTDEYSESLAFSAARGTLTDTSGVDTLNASAVSSSSNLNLASGAVSRIDGANLRMGAGTIVENAIGGDGNDIITGNASANSLRGMRGNDTLQGGAGNDALDGGQGIDTAVFTGFRKDYALGNIVAGVALTVTDGAAARDGQDSLVGIERLQFSDVKLALDVDATQSAGQTALLLGAVLPGRLYLDPSKQGLIGSVIGLFDQGFTLQQLSGALMRLPIWDVLTGKANPTSTDIANYLLTNVNEAVPNAATLQSAAAALSAQTGESQGDFLAQLAASSANQTHIGLVGLVSSGIIFL